MLCVISAAPYESAPLLDKLKKHSVEYEFYCCGVGPLNAAAFAAEFVRSQKNNLREIDLLYIGTAGDFGPFEEERVVQASDVRWVPSDLVSKQTYDIPGLYPHLFLNSKLQIQTKKNIIYRPLICSSTIRLSNDFEAMVRLGLYKKDSPPLENLELYSLAYFLKDKTQTFTALLGITNQIGPQAHGQWKKNYQKAAEWTAEIFSF